MVLAIAFASALGFRMYQANRMHVPKKIPPTSRTAKIIRNTRKLIEAHLDQSLVSISKSDLITLIRKMMPSTINIVAKIYKHIRRQVEVDIFVCGTNTNKALVQGVFGAGVRVAGM